MPDRTAIVVSAVFASFLAGVVLTTISGSAAHAGGDCITEPKDQPPQGSHWYYHVDPVTHRKCWHQRAEGLTIHQVGSSKPSPPAKPILQQSAEVDRQQPTADSHTEQPMVQSTTAGLTGQSTPETSTDAAGDENPPPSILSSRWPDPQSSGELDHGRELAHSAAADAGIDSKGRLPPVFTRDQVAAAERPPESSTDRMRLAVLVGALSLTAATGGLVFKYSAARRLRRADILDQRGSASTRQADVICDLPEPRELSCATEELRRHLVQLVEYGTFSRWPPIPPRNVDASFSYGPGGASGPLGRNRRQEVRYRHVRQRASQ
jgi:hypothetical protein